MSYRVLEALRNYSQHRGLPIQVFGFRGEWIDHGKHTAKRLQSAVPQIVPEKLRRDPKFKRSVSAELISLKKAEIPLLPWVKEYLGSLSAINSYARITHRPELLKVTAFRLHEVHRYVAYSKDNETSDVFAFGLSSGGKIQSEIYLGQRLERAIEVLQGENRLLTNFQDGHILT